MPRLGAGGSAPAPERRAASKHRKGKDHTHAQTFWNARLSHIGRSVRQTGTRPNSVQKRAAKLSTSSPNCQCDQRRIAAASAASRCEPAIGITQPASASHHQAQADAVPGIGAMRTGDARQRHQRIAEPEIDRRRAQQGAARLWPDRWRGRPGASRGAAVSAITSTTRRRTAPSGWRRPTGECTLGRNTDSR